MDEIKEKIRKIIKDNFQVDVQDDEQIFHHLDSINYIRYTILIENNFNVNVSSELTLRTIQETYDFLKNK
jgi:acyl carrier protein